MLQASDACSRNTGTSSDNGFILYNWLQNTGPLQNDLIQIVNIAATTKLPRQFELGLNFSYSSTPPFSAWTHSIGAWGDRISNPWWRSSTWPMPARRMRQVA